MGKYSKKLLNRVQEHNIKKVLDETDDLEVIEKELNKLGLGDFCVRRCNNEPKS